MYSTGTVTTTANSTKLVGTGTKWLNNINRVSVEQAIQIQIGATVHNNSIQSIQSDTELTLNFPFPTAAKDAKYVILTTMVHSVSDAMNKIVSMNSSNVQFSDILTRWMTEQGIITVTLPDQTTQQLRTTKEMDKQLDGKFDKAGGDINGRVTVNSSTIRISGTDDWPGLSIGKKNGEEVRIEASNTTETLLDISYRDTKNKRLNTFIIPRKSGTAMTVGEYGIGIAASPIKTEDIAKDWSTRFVATPGEPGVANSLPWGVGVHIAENAYGCVLHYDPALKTLRTCSTGKNNAVLTSINTVYSTANTTKDSNGNLKAASPIVKIFADDIDVNEESEGVTLKKLHTGIYQLCGVLGMHSDASWGGVNGGITIPSGINQLPLIYVDYDVLVAGERHPFNGEIIQQDEHGDIVIYISYRKHLDLPQNVQYARLKTYPEFAREIDGKLVELEAGEPIDIPNGHWIDVRVNMPSNSLYNQKQVEAQRLAKIEAERLAKEEAEHLAEEEERAEQEAAEQTEQQ
ncbi:phage tail fiber protein [Providencia heimbachae]|uniref:phage tail fiber protein n=2 Tax=Providencia heimbachae TaxID=333962 RepID=UPI000DA2AB62|nr:hypothetical protein [Providencia heimbachae]SQH13709.1 Uncharacterised protein [Providencia heimbachae]